MIWNKLTHNTGRLDVAPRKEFMAASLLLLLGIGFLAISIFKARNHCKKYGSLWAKIDRRFMYRYEQQRDESNVSRAGVTSSMTAYERE